MLRIEEVISRALTQTENDRYKLSVLVFARVKELNSGAKSLLPYSEDYIKKMDACDIALHEIAEGRILAANLLSTSETSTL